MQGTKQKDKAKPGQPTPVLDRARASDMNLSVLKRIDPEVEEVLANAGHVCLYRMSVEDQQWHRKNIEGTLFLIKRRTQPRFQMIVLNKLSTDNYYETVHGGLELEVNPPYLMYTHGNDEIHGIWFYDAEDIQRIATLLTKILSQLPKPEAGAQPEPALSPAPAVQQPEVQQPQPVQQQAPPQQQPQQQPPKQEQYAYQTPFQSTPPAAAPAAPAAPKAAPSQQKRGGGGDDFWDKSVHVTEETLPATSQHFAPNALLSAAAAPPAPASGGLTQHGLMQKLKGAQQRYSGGAPPPQQQPSEQSAAPTPPAAAATSQQHTPQPQVPAAPVPNSTSTPPGPAPLLTPSFFQKLQQHAASQEAAGTATPSAQQFVQQAPPAQQPQQPGVHANGTVAESPVADAGNGHNPLHALFSKAAKQVPPQPVMQAPQEQAAPPVRPLPPPQQPPMPQQPPPHHQQPPSPPVHPQPIMHPQEPSPAMQPTPPMQHARPVVGVPMAFMGRGSHPNAPGPSGPSPYGMPGQLPLPPAPPPQPQALGGPRERLRQAVGRLMQNDAFVDALVGELRNVGLLHQ